MLASSNGTLALHVLLVCVRVVLKCHPSFIRINKHDPNKYKTIYLHYLAKTYVRDDTQNSNENTNRTYLAIEDLPLTVDV